MQQQQHGDMADPGRWQSSYQAQSTQHDRTTDDVGKPTQRRGKKTMLPPGQSPSSPFTIGGYSGMSRGGEAHIHVSYTFPSGSLDRKHAGADYDLSLCCASPGGAVLCPVYFSSLAETPHTGPALVQDGTSKNSSHIPGYSGHIPAADKEVCPGALRCRDDCLSLLGCCTNTPSSWGLVDSNTPQPNTPFCGLFMQHLVTLAPSSPHVPPSAGVWWDSSEGTIPGAGMACVLS